MEKIKNIWIMITGSSSGIGKSTAKLLASRGARLILVARNENRLISVAREITAIHPEHHHPIVYPCDVSNYNEVKRMFKVCYDLVGYIDILINNAGVGIYGEYLHNSIEDFKQIMSINFFGALHCMTEVLLRRTKEKKLQIINIASVAALHGIPYLSAYSASKSALASASQSIKAEFYDKNVQINVIYPGYTNTDFFKKEKRVGKAVRPCGPYASPQNVARSILKTIHSKKRDRVLTITGSLLSFLHLFLPCILNMILMRYARKLNH